MIKMNVIYISTEDLLYKPFVGILIGFNMPTLATDHAHGPPNHSEWTNMVDAIN